MRKIPLLLLLFISTGAWTQNAHRMFVNELQINRLILQQGDSLHPALHNYLLADSLPFNAIMKPWHTSVEFAGNKLELSPVMEAAYESRENRSLLFSAGGLHAEAKWKKLQLHANFFGGYTKFSGPAFAQFDTTGLEPGYGYFGERNFWADATFRLRYRIAPFLNFTLGRGRIRTGTGIRSLLMGKQGHPYPFLNASLHLQSFQYEFRLMKLRGYTRYNGTNRFIEKYGVMHQFSWNITDWLNLYGFEAVLWGARDSVGYRGWEFNYLNPVIFLRPVEFSIGSPDNVLIGMGIQIRLWRNLLLYSQFVLDEFHLSYSKMQETWWANKYGLQAGFRWVNPLQEYPSWIQGEINAVRPFTYSHTTRFNAYAHALQPLAHPAGANFAEGLLRAGMYYRNWRFSIRSTAIIKGTDPAVDTLSYGGDVLKPYSLRNTNFGVAMLQGDKQALARGSVQAAWLLQPENRLALYARLGLEYRHNGQTSHTTPYFRLGITTRLTQPETDFIY